MGAKLQEYAPYTHTRPPASSCHGTCVQMLSKKRNNSARWKGWCLLKLFLLLLVLLASRFTPPASNKWDGFFLLALPSYGIMILPPIFARRCRCGMPHEKGGPISILVYSCGNILVYFAEKLCVPMRRNKGRLRENQFNSNTLHRCVRFFDVMYSETLLW